MLLEKNKIRSDSSLAELKKNWNINRQPMPSELVFIFDVWK